ncbi:uncharacterized protein [Diabrotica undecimpunctata]|uniref:uncharacterized protein n=1 Tax=Diabrotica undecimpunctata TaxID=50387 RepID=UPI003B63536A
MKTSCVLAILVCVGLTVSAQDDSQEIMCQMCVGLAEQVQDNIRKDFPLDKVEEEVKETCHMLNVIPKLEQKCLEKFVPIVDEMYDKLNSTSPQKFCEFLELCVGS